MKFLRIIFLLLPFTVNAQQIEIGKFSCDDLKSILESKIIIDHFYLNKVKDSIIVVDTFQVFRCNDLRIADKDAKLVRAYFPEISQGVNSYSNFKGKPNRVIVLLQVRIIENKYFLIFWQPHDNATFEVSLSRRKKLKVISMGVF